MGRLPKQPGGGPRLLDRHLVKKRSSQSLRDDFLAWQCRIRQSPCARTAGVPRPACARACSMRRAANWRAALTVLIIPRDPSREHRLLPLPGAEDRRPARSLRARAELFAGRLFSAAGEFSDVLTAVLPADSRSRRQADQGRAMRAGVRSVLATLSRCRARRSRLEAGEADPRGDALAQPAVQSRAARRRPVLGFRPNWDSAKSRIGRTSRSL